ncbi:cobyrinate a,c-diamide synthase [bacterium]|nr:cobyrinate a,c-diamide synthase [bacterium]
MSHEQTLRPLSRVLLAGASRGAGTSSAVLGLLAVLKRKGQSVAAARIGHGLVETTFHRRVIGRLSHSLDPWILSLPQLLDSLGTLSLGTDLLVIEGDIGIFDSYQADAAVKNLADFALLTETPVILVVNAKQYAEGIKALVSGFINYDRELKFAGIICSHILDDKHEQVIRRAVESLGSIPYLGSIFIGDSDLLAGKEYGRAPAVPSLISRSKIVHAADLVERGVDVGQVRSIADAAPALKLAFPPKINAQRRVRIAVADDAAFHLTFQNNLDILRSEGAELVPFSPLADQKLPARIGGIYLPSGYPHLYAQDLQNNANLRAEIHAFASGGGTLYAEGTALAYCCKQLQLTSGDIYEMLGILPGLAKSNFPESESARLALVEVSSFEETVISHVGSKFRGLRDLRFHVRLEDKVLSCFQILDPSQGSSVTTEGLSPHSNTICTSVLAHWGANSGMAKTFIEAAAMQVIGQ